MLSLFSIRSFLITSYYVAFFKFVLGNDVGNSAGDCSMKTILDATLYGKPDGTAKVVGSVIISDEGTMDPSSFNVTPWR